MMSATAFRQVTQDRSLYVPAGLFLVLLCAVAFRGQGLFTNNGLAGAILVATPLILTALAIT
ncbi:ABC transporter permease, partial [Rhizobium jaguaris]